MRRASLPAVIVLALVAILPVRFRSTAEARPDEEPAKATGPDGADDAEVRAKRLEEFGRLMSGATLDGQWRLVKDGRLGPERAEKYTIGEVKHLEGDKWTIQARIVYGEKDVSIPVPVNVEWAGDTPVISVTDLWMPGLGKYTARVMIYRGLYTGSWFGADYGGLMSGVVVPKGDATPAK